MSTRVRTAILVLLGALVLLVGVPWLLSGWILFLLTVAGAKALAVLGIVLLLRGKLLTFGHALYYAVGAYAAGMAVKYLGVRETLVLLALSLAAGVAISALLGLLVTRYRAVYFALLNLAFSMVLYGMLLKLYSITGGTDGLGIAETTLAGFRLGGSSLRLAMYELTVVLVALLVYATYRFFMSPTGYTLRAIKDNEVRVEYMGVSVWRTVYVSYIIAGGLACSRGRPDRHIRGAHHARPGVLVPVGRVRLRGYPRRHREHAGPGRRLDPVRVRAQLCVRGVALHLADDAGDHPAVDHLLPAGRSVES